MSVVVGVAPDGRSTAAVRLAATLARAAGEDLVLATVVPAHWPPGVGRIDAEYQAYLDGIAQPRWTRRGPSCPRTSR